jgi:hypothetical protein
MSVEYIVEHQGKKIQGLPPIYIDDTIDTLKRKIILSMNQEIAYDAIYLYGVKIVEFNPEYLHEILTQAGTIDLTHERLEMFLSNFIDKSIIDRIGEKKTVYSMTDLYALRLEYPHLMKFSIGITANGHLHLPYYFPADPISVTYMDEFIIKNADKMISTQNANLVMDLGNLHENKFILVLAEDIDFNLVKIYYPFLEKAGITTKTVFDRNREKLIEQNTKFLSAAVLKSYESVNIFYEHSKKSTYKSVTSGITTIDFSLSQKREMVLPLEILFKIIHATRQYPFIKLNPGMRQESMIRLFTASQTITGRKIPFLSKGTIMKLLKSIGKTHAIGVYICENILCSIYPNGNVQIICDFEEDKELEEIDEHIRILVNPLLEEVKKYIEHSGLQFDLFNGFERDEKRIQLNSLKYKMSFGLQKKINLKPVMGCVSSVFNVIQDNITKEDGIQMRFKRVANYNEMTAIDAFIRTAINKGNLRESVISLLRDNFDLSEEEAESKFITFIGEEEVKMGLSGNSKLRIRDNPGFLTTMEVEKFKGILHVVMEIEDNIDYLNIIPIYLNSLVELGQGMFDDSIKAICSRKTRDADIAIPEILTPGQLPFSENKTPIVEEGEELVFDDEGDDDMLDALLFGSEGEEGEGEEGATDMVGGATDMVGGAPDDDDDESHIDITGMSLSNPNPFSKRMEDRDPTLFLKKDKGKFKAYSRMCASNMRRQPVILTQEEKERIDAEHKGSYSEAIKYGSDPKNPYYYICPRYWSIPENTSLTDEEVEARKRGPIKVNDPVMYKEGENDIAGTAVDVEDERIKIKNKSNGKEEWQPRENVLKDIIIPLDAKKVPKGQTIYEFAVKKGARAYNDFIGADGKYITHYPGFISGGKHPDGLCMPCCFKRSKGKETAEQRRRRKECIPDQVDGDSAEISPKRETTTQQKDYIKGYEKFPLEEGRMGYLPIELQLFFQEDSKQYQISELDPSLKEDAITLLRYGVESSEKQSFIACIASVYEDMNDEEYTKRVAALTDDIKKQRGSKKQRKRDVKVQLREKITSKDSKISIKEMREIIANTLTLDNFTNYQNGNLVTEFFPGNVDSVNIDDYADTLLYQQLDTSDSDQFYYMERLIAAYENFLNYIRSDDSEIDYQYLWDIITLPNPYLFPSGINLVILEIPEDDVTANVNIICPTNHYSQKSFNTLERTLILVKKNGFFEPICLYNNLLEKSKALKFLFREQNLEGKPNIKQVLSKIRKYMNTSCKPLPSQPKEYVFKENFIFDEVANILGKKNIDITALEVNYNGKAIGVHIKHPDGDEGYIPCYPSNYSVKEDLPIIFMDGGEETKNRMGYEDTFRFLKKTHKITGLPCDPVCKVVEDDLIVGIITETNQLVMLNSPAEFREGEDEEIALRVCRVKPYLSASKAGLNEKGVDTARVEFMNALRREKNHYSEFRNLVRVQLNKIGNIQIKNDIIKLIDNEDPDSLSSYQKTIEDIVDKLRILLRDIVEFVDSGKGVDVDKHIYSKINSLTGADNEELYFIRLADELLRFRRIRLFMLETNKYLSFSDVHYDLNDDEILLIESMINQEFFQELKAYKRNKFIHFNTYDTALPMKTVPYSEKLAITNVCDVKHMKNLPNWFKREVVNNKKFTVNEYNTHAINKRTVVCTYNLILTIMQYEKSRNPKSKLHELTEININELKKILIEEYNKYDENKVLTHLFEEGKQDYVRNIRGGKNTLEQYIRSDEYAITLLDIWMLANHFDVPILFFGQYKLNINGKKSFATKAYNKRNQSYYFIRIFRPVMNTIPRYFLLVNPEKSIFINIKSDEFLIAKFNSILFINKLGKQSPSPLPITISEYIEK